MTLSRTRNVHALGAASVEPGVWVILSDGLPATFDVGLPTPNDCDVSENVWQWVSGAFGFWPRFRPLTPFTTAFSI
jgi:hypothetical protein